MGQKIIFTNSGGTEFKEVASTRLLTSEFATRDTVAWGAGDFAGVLGWLPNPDPVC
jgi:hypothetical protein